MSEYAIGMIGNGGFGHFLQSAWEPMDEVTVCAVADLDEANRPDGVFFYTDWHELLADPLIDIVSVATPPHNHAEIACEALQAGKHVLVEKPLATTLEDARRVMQVERETGKLVSVDYMLRFNPIVEVLQQWSKLKSFGKLRRVLVENYAQDDELPPEHWFWKQSESGGILVEHGVHFIDLVQGCTTSSPREIEGQALRRPNGITDRMMVIVRYGNRLMTSHYHDFSRPGFFERTSMRFVFDLAQIEAKGWIPMDGDVEALVNGDTGALLSDLPNFDIKEKRPLAETTEGSQQNIQSGGESYRVKHEVKGEFYIDGSKADAYASALRALMTDFVAAISSPNHQRRITSREGFSSLEIAIEVTNQAGLSR